MNTKQLPLILVILSIALVILAGCTTPPVANGTLTADQIKAIPAASAITTFSDSNNSVCSVDGKPIIRMIGTTWCPHCKWVTPAFDGVVNQYVAEGKIVAYHWNADIGDNELTPAVETAMPDTETKVFLQFNPAQSIPTFIFGCKYYRIGNGYEAEKDLNKEVAEFKAAIDALLTK